MGTVVAMSRPQVGQSHIRFNSSPAPTVGVEVELWLLDRHTGALVPAADDVLRTMSEGHPGEHPKAKHELFRSTIEVITGICDTVPAAGSDLRATIAELATVGGSMEIDLMASGTHPFSRWQDQLISPGARYQEFVGRLGWPVRRLAITGLHVHVGVSGPGAAIALTRSLCEQLPLLLALSASSPFWEGADTDLASVRTKVFESLPTSGLPPQMNDWRDFELFMHALLRARVISSVREVWWDIRPHPNFGTVEFRMCDAVPTLSETLGVAALAQCLVVEAERRFADGDPLPGPRDWVLAENKWLACRHGLEAELLVDDVGNRQDARTLLAALVQRLAPLAVELGCGSELSGVLEVLERGGASSRQRAVLESGGGVDAVVEHLVAEFRGPGGFL